MKDIVKYIFLLFLLVLINGTTLRAQNFARGVDVGWLSEMEASGRIWRDSNGVQKDLFDILPDYCINSIRLRVWVNPAGGWSGKQDVIELAKRAHDKGYRLMIDFHYSDNWADPGKQYKPAAWENYSVQQLEQAVYDHTVDVLDELKNEGIYPEWVQVGNETNNGMLWPEGQASTNMANYARFVDSGYEAVKNVFPNAQVIVHVSNGYDNGLFRWNIGGLINNGARFDVIAMSMYPDSPADWLQYADDALANMQDMISRYNKPIMVSEIGLATSAPTEARAFLEQVITNLQSLNNNNGLGIFWWEPQAYDWRGYGKVAWNGNYGATPYQATDAMKGFQYGCSETTTDCNGTENGRAYLDDCGNCVGGTTGESACEPVEVTFRVDMENEDVSNGIFITGTFTEVGDTWQIIPMQQESGSIYIFTEEFYPGDTGAYYFLNANDWNARENVPEACALAWGSDRLLEAVTDKELTLDHVWASCGGLVTSTENLVSSELAIYPNPSNTGFTIQTEALIHYELLSSDGLLVESGHVDDQKVIGSSLGQGVYYLVLKNQYGVITRKMIKQ